MKILLSLLLPMAALATQVPYGVPKLYCRDTNESVYAEVCVPAFETKTEPVTLPVKVVKDDQYCYNQIRTVCEETTKVQPREICTYSYVSKKEILPATTTKVTYEEKSETMKVTTCKASGYGGGYSHGGEHQYCHEEYQTQAYKIPIVTMPEEVAVDVAVPEPVKQCVTKNIEVTEVVCEDISEERCFNVAMFEDSTNTVDQVEAVLGAPKCDQITLTLPTQACSKPYH